MFNWLKKLTTRSNPFDNPGIKLAEALAPGWTRDNSSGYALTPHTLMGIPAARRAIQLVSGDLAKLDLECYRKGPNGSRDIFEDHSCYNLLHWRPSPLYSAVDWKRAVMSDVLGRGNHYSWIIRNEFHEPDELFRIDPDQVDISIVGSNILYKVRLNNGEEKIVLADDMLHFKGLGSGHFNGILGIDVLTVMADALGCAGAIQKFAAKYFSNNCHPGITLEYLNMPARGTGEDKDAMKKTIDKLNMGLNNSHRLFVVPWGFKLVDNQVDAEAAQLLGSRQFTLIDMANAIGVSANRIGAQISTGHNSLESERQSSLEELEVYLCSIEEELNYKLLTESEKRLGRIYFEFDRSNLQKPDAKTFEDIWTDRLNNGKCTWNEYRQATNQSTEPASQKWADMHRIPAQILYAEQVAEKGEQDPTEQTGPQDPAAILPNPNQPEAADTPPGGDTQPQNVSGRFRDLVSIDVDRMVTRLGKAIQGKPAEWFASEDFLTHRDVIARSLPWGEPAIDEFLEQVIEQKNISPTKVQELKEKLWTSN